MFGRIAGHLQGDGVQRERLIGIEQHQDKVRHPFESVESCRASHGGEPTAADVGMTALAHPLDWHLDIFWTVAIPALVVAYIVADPLRGESGPLGVSAASSSWGWSPWSWRSCGRWETWPPTGPCWPWWLQRLLLMLAVPPLLVAGTPRPIIARLTRPAAVDAVLRLVVKPMPAVAIVTVVAVGTLTTGAGQPGRPLAESPGW